jgi:hypothetical protein
MTTMPDPDAGGAEARNDVDHLTSDILRRWRRRLRRRADDRPRSGDRGESERLLVASLLRASSSSDDTILPGLAAAAARYGAGQRRDRPDPGGLCDELSCLRQLVWTELKSQEPSVHAAVDRILRFDRALSIVVKAAVTAGYSPGILARDASCSDETHATDQADNAVPNERQEGA